jgi:beta-lactam-binding protein with PASTA domain
MPRRLRDVAPEVPADYEAIVMKLLSKSPSNRYADGDDLRADLKRFRDGLPVAAAPRPAATVAPVAPTTINAPVTPARGTEVVRPAAATTVQPRQQPQPVPSQPARVSNDPMIAQQQRPAARPAPTGPAYDDEPKRTGWYIAAGVLVLVLAGLLTWFLTHSNKTAKTTGVAQVTIPTDLINQPKEVVAEQLIKLKLIPRLEGRNTDQAVLNNVFLLDPPGGSVVDAASEVKVIYNSGPNKKTVSNFVGGTDVAAKANLTALGLPFVINPVESADKPAGTVIAQDPPPGDYPPGQKVTLTVSNGVTQIPLPNITGLGRDAAISQLTALGLKPSSELAASDTVEKDKVIGYKADQVPTVPKDSPIVILISSGIGDQVVPGLAGLTQDEAFAKIQEAGFLVGNPLSKDVLLGGPEDSKVVAQDPAANTKAAKKSKITVTIGRGVAPATTTTLAPTTIATTTTIAATTTTVAPAPSFGVAVTVKKTGAADSTYAETATAGATASYTWRIVVSNTGNTTLTGFSITSTVPACIFTPDPFDVAAGANKTLECTTAGISAIGPLTNTATVKPTASSAGGVPGPKSDGAIATTTAP